LNSLFFSLTSSFSVLSRAEQPTTQPVARPSRQPTEQPTEQPTRQPTHQPTAKSYGKVGYLAHVYYSDARCTNVTVGTYRPLGVCNYQGSIASVVYTADPSGGYQLYATYYYAYGNCTGPASTFAITDAACVASSDSSGPYTIAAVYLPSLPAFSFPYAKYT
jgi:hypothetical protein